MSQYTKEQLINHLQDFYKRNGNSIGRRMYERSGERPTVYAFKSIFGSWTQAIRKAGLEIVKPKEEKIKSNKAKKPLTDEEIIQVLNEFYRSNGYISFRLYDKMGWSPSRETIVKRFGSWNEALRKAGLFNKLTESKSGVCPVCENEFVGRRLNQMTCSKKCSSSYEWRTRNKN